MKILKIGVLSIILYIALSSSLYAQELEQIYYAPRAVDLRKEIDSLLNARISIEKEALPFNSELKEAIENFNMAFKKDAGSVLTKTSLAQVNAKRKKLDSIMTLRDDRGIIRKLDSLRFLHAKAITGRKEEKIIIEKLREDKKNGVGNSVLIEYIMNMYESERLKAKTGRLDSKKRKAIDGIWNAIEYLTQRIVYYSNDGTKIETFKYE